MSRPLRIEYRDAWYHVLNRGSRRESIFREERDYENFLQTVQEASESWHLRVSAYCLMPNHYHLVVQTPRGNLSRCMRHIDGVYTQRFNRLHGHDGPLFRGRYKALLMEADRYLLALVRYVHRNPLEAGLAEALENYRWSSHRGYVSRNAKWKWLHKGIVLEMLSGNPKERLKVYKEYMKVQSDERIIRIFSRKRWPAFLGSERFLIGLKERFFPKKVDVEVPQSKELSPDRDTILAVVSEYYRVQQEDLSSSRRGFFNEARNVAIYLTRKLRGDTLEEIGAGFGIDRYSTVSSVVERMKALVEKDEEIRTKVDRLTSMVIKSQEQT